MGGSDNIEQIVYRAWEDADICRDCIARLSGCELSADQCELAGSLAHTIRRFCQAKENPALAV